MNSSVRPDLPLWPLTALVIAYPLILHASVARGDPWPVAVLLAVVCLWLALRGWVQGRYGNLVAALLSGGVVLGLAGQGQLLQLLYWQPVVISSAGGWLFGRTLMAGRVPLVTRLARLDRGELSAALLRYTRQVTLAWTLLFALLTVEMVLLWWWATPTVWSLFANGINYLLIGLFFVGEYVVRICRFRHLEHPGFMTYLRTLNRPDLRAVLRRPWV